MPLPFLFLLVIGTLILGPYIAWKLLSHRRLLDAWRHWAAAHGYEFVTSNGPFGRMGGAHVRGKRAAIQFELKLCAEPDTESSKVFTQLLARGPQLVSAPLELFQRSWLSRVNKALTRDWIELDDSALNDRWLVRGERADEARSMLAGDLRRCLLDCVRIESVSFDGGEVEVRFDGEIRDERVLDLALELACAAWSGKTNQGRPARSALAR